MFGTLEPVGRGALTAVALLVALFVPTAESVACEVGRVDVYDRDREQALEIHRHRGRNYVIGTPGNEYAIRIRNCTGERVLAVVSVDGVNVITGETAAPDQSGYVIEPWGYVNIQGWRKDLDQTAAFHFTDPGNSYAARTGRPDDLGVIGAALFRERRQLAFFSAEKPAASAAAGAEAAPQEAASDSGRAARAPLMEPSLGTGHGRREYDPAERVEFERASRWPDQRVVIRYDRRENLVAMGVLPSTPRWHEPDPFPAALGFVPDP